MSYLEFDQLRAANIERAKAWHGEGGWSLADWSNAAAGEMGEVCNAVKKLRRFQDSIPDSRAKPEGELIHDIAMEIGDTIVYLDLLANVLGIDLGAAVIDTFNRVSIRESLPQRLGPKPEPCLDCGLFQCENCASYLMGDVGGGAGCCCGRISDPPRDDDEDYYFDPPEEPS